MRAGTGEFRTRPGQRRIKARAMVGILCRRAPPGRGWGPDHAQDSLAWPLLTSRFPWHPSCSSASLCPAGTPSYGDTMVGANLKVRGSKTPGSANPHTVWGSPERQRNKCRVRRSKVTLHCGCNCPPQTRTSQHLPCLASAWPRGGSSQTPVHTVPGIAKGRGLREVRVTFRRIHCCPSSYHRS